MTDPVLNIDRWHSFTRKLPYGVIKTGFVVNPENPLELIPNPETIAWIEKGFDYLQEGNSLREVCEWLTQKIHRQVSHQTLASLYKTYRVPYIDVGKTKKRKRKPVTRDVKKLISEKAKARGAIARALKQERIVEERKRKLQPEDYTQLPQIPVAKADVFKGSPDRSAINFAFKPHPGPQERFLGASEEEVLYGGAAGGGKSMAMIADPMRYFSNPNFVGLLLRRTNDELKELIRETKKLYPKIFEGAKWKEQASMWVFPSGAEFWMTYCDRDDDVLRYQGQAFCWIGIDELTQYSTPFAWNYLKSRLRTTDPTLKPHLSMRATTNPGGPGHQWVKKMFVDPAIPGEPFWATDEHGETLRYPEDHKDPKLAGKPLFQRVFIPAKLSDNPSLADDGAYERSLLGLPEDQRRKLLDGDWSVTEGAAFPEFNPKYHVVKPFEVPSHWVKFRAGDYGYSSFSAVLWIAVNPTSGQLVVYRELYKSKLTGVDLGYSVLVAEKDETVKYGVLDSSVWHERGNYGPSIAEEMISIGCKWKKSDRGNGSRVAGKQRLHELLKLDPYTNQPGIVFFESCRQVIADLPMIPSDPDGGEDIDDRYKSDHTYDALRYGIMSRPRPGGFDEWGSKKYETPYTPANKEFGY